MKYIVLLTITVFVCSQITISQTNLDSVSENVQIDNLKLGLVITGTVGMITLAHIQSYNSWWKGERCNFHFAEDGGYARGADKLGHFYFTYLSSDLLGRSLIWSGIKAKDAFLLSGTFALLFQLYVEVEDATVPTLGFSVGDGIADILGAAYPTLQNKISFLQNVYPKWSVIKSEQFKKGKYRSIIDDYESQYYWLSFNLDGLLGKSKINIFPSFLNLAVGYGVKDVKNPEGGYSELYLSLDVDFTKLPGEGSFLQSVKHALNYFHMPSPTIRVLPSVVFYGLKF